MVPTTRSEFKDWVLRKLGSPAIKIRVTEEQVDDRVDEALWMYATFHGEGNDRFYYKYQISAADKQNKFIILPENIIGAVRVFDLGSAFGTGDLFNVQYQLALNDLWTLTNFNLVPYYMAFEHLQVIQQILVGRQPIRYSRNTNTFYLDTNWDRFAVGDWIVIECLAVIDPEEYERVWGDVWLQKYTAALVKRNWGENMTLFADVPLVGGQKFNAERILQDANLEVQRLEQELRDTWEIPPSMMVG